MGGRDALEPETKTKELFPTSRRDKNPPSLKKPAPWRWLASGPRVVKRTNYRSGPDRDYTTSTRRKTWTSRSADRRVACSC